MSPKIYVFGGVDVAGVPQRSTFVYDPFANLWTQGADMPTAREQLVAETIGGAIYVIGGRDASGALAVNERYDPATNTWSTRASMPTPRGASGIAAFGGRIFVLGGEASTLRADVEVYDPSNDAWSQQAPLPLARHGLGAVALDDRILVPGGGVAPGVQPVAYVDAFVPLSTSAQHVCTCASTAPCANVSSEAGCRNSTGAGAVLTATGVASVSGDSLVLWASGMPPSTTALFFQGTALVGGGAGAFFGDGLRCAGGAVVRLGVESVTGGAARYPSGSDASVSSRGQINGATTRFYQAWYRNSAGPCGSGSNTTNAVAIAWSN